MQGKIARENLLDKFLKSYIMELQYFVISTWEIEMDIKEILEKHVKWLRGEEGGERANLYGVDLHGMDLRDADFRDVDLHGADLRGVDLRGVDLRGADLRGADLRGTDFRDADLHGADLLGAEINSSDTENLVKSIGLIIS